MTKYLKNYWSDQSGAAAAEYALILAIVGTAIAGASIILGGAVSTSMSTAATCITSTGKTCP
ncbi:Flp family type IVb pilin [Rhizorhabdus argentea]|uniref:Flp family type IVb pilin n=1 Tax=Rhizorhabdus argentea TaxID=1387174 RepID=UPI0030EE9967